MSNFRDYVPVDDAEYKSRQQVAKHGFRDYVPEEEIDRTEGETPLPVGGETKCHLCDFEGKNAKSLRAHINFQHVIKDRKAAEKEAAKEPVSELDKEPETDEEEEGKEGEEDPTEGTEGDQVPPVPEGGVTDSDELTGQEPVAGTTG